MIKSFKSKEAEKFFNTRGSAKFPSSIQKKALMKLHRLDVAETIDEMKNPPGNRLEKLSGKLKDYYSVRINDQWRIIFKWEGQDAFDVAIVDYH